jgi:hypothetical protein
MPASTPVKVTVITSTNQFDGFVNVPGGGAGASGQANTTLSNGVNHNVDIPQDYLIIANGPTAAFSIAGFSGIAPPPGLPLVVQLLITEPCTLINDSGSDAIPILTPSGSDYLLAPGAGMQFALTYDENVGAFRLLSPGAPQVLTINVKDYGAVGDGVTDSTAAILAAVASIKALGPVASGYSGVELVFPHGVYLCSEPLDFDNTGDTTTTDFPCITLRGAGGAPSATIRSASTLIFTGVPPWLLGPVVATGTSPPTATLSGTPLASYGFLIQITSGGVGTAAAFEWSSDGGVTFTTGVSVAAAVVLGATGVTAHFAVTGSDTYAANNVYSSYSYSDQLSARGSTGFTLERIAILYNNAGFAGTLVDVSANAEATPSGCTCRDDTFGSDGNAYATAHELVMFDGMEDGLIENCAFIGAASGIRGVRLGIGSQGNRVVYRANYFIDVTSSVVNPGFQAITIDQSTFEGTQFAIFSDFGQEELCNGLTFQSNWLGDTPTAFANDAWITPGFLQFRGAVFSGNNFDSLPASGASQCRDSIRLGSCQGVAIHGNTINTIDFAPGTSPPGSDPQGVVVKGNTFLGSNTQYAPFFRTLEVFSGSSVEYLQSVFDVDIGQNYNSEGLPLDVLVIGGHLCTRPVYGIQPTVLSSGTNVTVTIADSNEFEGSNDTAGRLEIVVGAGGFVAGVVCTVKFGMGYDFVNGLPPKLVLQPETSGLPAALLWTTPTWSQFIITADGALAAGTYYLSYMVMQ